MKSRIVIIGSAALGLLLAGIGFEGLRKREEGVKFHGNPFAIRQSGYGMILARLSQNTVDKAWHMGVEGVSPHEHVHGPECAHLPGHGEGAHEKGHDGKEPGVETPERHQDHENHERHGHAEADEGHDHEIAGGDHPHDETPGDEPGHVHGPHCEHDHGPVARDETPGDEPGHVHGPDCEHDHGAVAHDEKGKGIDPLDRAISWIGGMRSARYRRTNPYGINDAHRLVVARDIEEILLRSYNMDPTNYGVYNAYYLFLTIHELRATPRAKDHARKVSDLTIGAAFKEDTNPAPWLTASAAVLNLFFLDQEKSRETGNPLPVAALEDYRQKMGYCLQQYAVLKQKAIAEGRWKAISSERRRELDEREQFSTIAFAQFDAMLARQGKGETDPTVSEEGESEGTVPIVGNDDATGKSGNSGKDDR